MTLQPRPHARLATLASAALLALAAGGCRYEPYTVQKPDVSSPPKLKSTDRVAAESVLRARRLLDQGLDTQALSEFERAIENNPLLVGAYMSAGDIYMKQGDFDMAALRFGEAARLAPQSYDANFKWGQALQALGQAVEAVRAYLIALAIKPNDPAANMNVSVAYLQMNDAERALPYAEKAVKLEPMNPKAHTNLGSIYSALGRHDEAVSEYLQANELLPPSTQVLLNLADSLIKSNQLEQAANTLEQVIKIEPSANAYERLGFVNFRMRKYEESKAAFLTALEIDPNHFPSLNGAAVCYLNAYEFEKNDADRQEAVKLLRRSLTLNRDQPRFAAFLAKYQLAK
ncbi:MAG: tetratricopeptide repeat protein [Tepidisphaera sp.]